MAPGGRNTAAREAAPRQGVSAQEPLKLAYSPCPNDTFIFHAWVHGLVPGAPPVTEVLADIDALNAMTLRGEPEVAKVSFHALAHLLDRYALLHAGGALGRGCGPLVVVRRGRRGESPAGDAPEPTAAVGAGTAAWLAALPAGRVAIPGALTTAALLVRLFAPGLAEPRVMRFDRIMPAVEAGEVDAGVIIHESRFTYPKHGLSALVDLGAWWEGSTGHPIPLGGIVVRRDLGREVAATVDRAIRESLRSARSDPDAPWPYIREHSQEMDEVVCREHIALYVNDFSLDYGSEGEAAIRHLLSSATAAGVARAPVVGGVFWDDADDRSDLILSH